MRRIAKLIKAGMPFRFDGKNIVVIGGGRSIRAGYGVENFCGYALLHQWPPALTKLVRDDGYDKEAVGILWENAVRKYAISTFNKNINNRAQFSTVYKEWMRLWDAENRAGNLPALPERLYSDSMAKIGIVIANANLQVPKDGETPEMWLSEAQKTKQMIMSSISLADEIKYHIQGCTEVIEDKNMKMEHYIANPLNKDGSRKKMIDRFPEWQQLMDDMMVKIDQLEDEAQRTISSLQELFDTASPTVSMEKEIQRLTEEANRKMEMIKQFNMLKELNEQLDKAMIDLLQGTAQTAGMKARANVFEDVWNWLKGLWNKLVNWIKDLAGVNDRIEDFIDIPVPMIN